MNDSICTISILPTNSIRIVKQIHISSAIRQINCYASIIYLRQFNLNYQMKHYKLVDNNERLHRNLFGVPEEEYPNDELDKLIFDAIKMKYSNATLQSSILSTYSEVFAFQRNLEMKRMIDSMIIVEPDFSTLNPCLYSGVEIPHIPLELYIEMCVNNYQLFEEPFWVSCDNNQWIDFRTIIDTKIDSMELLSHYLSQHSKSCNQ